ncbi:hypothetical protein [Sanyastnella coralliicola]|uniref:hypothetical protein n=1 Tax=Sanyastnella coralliicola TaxID=3069118 RepID=UPI0027B8C915|nr:hypothetical protein [Longitalea sp. SCSIO 12813]
MAESYSGLMRFMRHGFRMLPRQIAWDFVNWCMQDLDDSEPIKEKTINVLSSLDEPKDFDTLASFYFDGDSIDDETDDESDDILRV